MNIKSFALTIFSIFTIQAQAQMAPPGYAYPCCQSNTSEQELMRAYLQEVQKRTDLEARNELARIDYQREVFQEYNRRWWENYDQSQRNQKITDYWNYYYSGKDYATQALANLPGNAKCKTLIFLADPQQLPNPNQDPILNEAFHRGIVASAPECFQNDWLSQLKSLDQKVGQLNNDLWNVEKDLQIDLLDPVNLNKLRLQKEGDLKAQVDSVVAKYIPRVAEAAGIDPADLLSVQAIVDRIATTMQCSNLVDNHGTALNCHIQIVPAAYPVDKNAAYKVLLSKQQLGIYQVGINSQDFMRSVQYYIRNVSPADTMVQIMYSQLVSMLRKVDQNKEARQSTLQAAFDQDYCDMMDNFELSLVGQISNDFSNATRRTWLDKLHDLQFKMISYRKWELQGNQEQGVLNQVVGDFNTLLDRIQKTSVEIPAATKPVVIELTDSAHSRITLPNNSRGGHFYLLGRTQSEVTQWISELKVQQ